MVNDQLVRIHQLRLLSYEKMSPKFNSSDLSPDKAESSSSSSPLLSSSAPDTSSFQHDKSDGAQSGSKKQKTRLTSLSKSQNSSPTRGHQHHQLALKKQHSTGSSDSGNQQSGKRRSSWRNLLSPSYKSRSDEFHKLFCDKIPKNERLIADYACALHKDILIQGRVYISINYVAFYSNLFSWITKLVVRLRDISQIHKANTYKVVPNAIHLVMKTGDKHVLASFVARDKSYMMILRLWQNNLLRERMSDQEIKSLVHLGYGKDLGMSDNEELEINSPDPKTPANVPDDSMAEEAKRRKSTDGNNNSKDMRRSLDTLTSGGEEEEEEEEDDDDEDDESEVEEHIEGPATSGHSRYNSIDYRTGTGEADQQEVMSKLTERLHDLSESHNRADCDTLSPTASSAVVLDTPDRLAVGPGECGRNTSQNMSLDVEPEEHQEERQTEELMPRTIDDNNDDACDSNKSNRHSVDTASSSETQVANIGEGDEKEHQVEAEIQQAAGQTHRAPVEVGADKQDEEAEGEEEMHLTCGCEHHEGQLIADQEFDINVDTLFSLIFTNSKFMRTYMIRRGMTDSNISNWRRSTGDKSNSSSLSSEDSRRGVRNVAAPNGAGSSSSSSRVANKQVFRSRQVRQLNYSMNINHMWAKQVQIEEKQNIFRAQTGVYVLKSQSSNSGVPYGETFTVDVTYCLTRFGSPGESRMLVHALINFHKDKQNWKLAMVKSLIEKQCLQGVNEFTVDLVNSIKDYIKRRSVRLAAGRQVEDEQSQQDDDQQGLDDEQQDGSSVAGRSRKSSRSQQRPEVGGASRGASLGSSNGNQRRQHQKGGSLARAKSKLKERKLRNMYKYYMFDEQQSVAATGEQSGHEKGGRFELEYSSDASSLFSSLQDDDDDGDGGQHADDNSSMMMMMTAHEKGSQVADFGFSRRSFSDQDDDDDQDSDQYSGDRKHGHSTGSTSTSSASSGSSSRRSHKGCCCGRRRDCHDNNNNTDHNSLSSANSNTTLNNGNLLGENDRSSWVRKGRQLEGRASRRLFCRRRHNSGSANDVNTNLNNKHLTRPKSPAKVRSSSRLQRRADKRTTKINKRTGTRGSPGWNLLRTLRLNGVLWPRTAGGVFVITLMPILVAILISQVIVLRRLEAIESSLGNRCDLSTLPTGASE